MLTFWLGVHRANWLSQTDVPLFLSRRQLVERKTYPRARGPWSQDSGGFTELHLFGGWDTPVNQFIEQTRRHRDEIGHMTFAAPQDWMCEPAMLKQTGLTVGEHISRTVANYQTLMLRAPDVPWIPVLQGWEPDDYLRCWDAYDRAGVDLEACSLVGVGTVCRRQHTQSAVDIFSRLAPLRLHGFGVKTAGLRAAGNLLASADSMAWSYRARRSNPLPGHTHTNCANCLDYALAWRTRVLATELLPVQLPLMEIPA